MESQERKIPLFKVFMSESVKDEIIKTLYSGYIGQGPKVDEFEELLKIYLLNDYLVTLNSGTSGLHLALHILKDYVKGNEVLATPLTCTASNWPILANNFNIKWVDIDPDTLNMDLDDLARKITKNTQIILLVHWGGVPIDLDKVDEIILKAKYLMDTDIWVIEDCAHSMGAEYKNRKIGSNKNLCVFSFQAIKHLTSIDGGLLTLPDRIFYKRAKLLRWYGIDRETDRVDFRCEGDIVEWGFKFHMNDVSATVGIENFKNLQWILLRHRSNANFYRENLSDFDGIKLLKPTEDCEPSWWIYTIKVRDRDNFTRMMKSKGIMVSRVHERNDIHSCVDRYSSILPNLDRVIKDMIAIPVGWWVNEEDRTYIVKSIKEGW